MTTLPDSVLRLLRCVGPPCGGPRCQGPFFCHIQSPDVLLDPSQAVRVRDIEKPFNPCPECQTQLLVGDWPWCGGDWTRHRR